MSSVQQILNKLTGSQVEERHGLILSLAAILRMIREIDQSGSQNTTIPIVAANPAWLEILDVSEKEFTTARLRPELVAEALCTWISAYGSLRHCSPPISAVVSRNFTASLPKVVQIIELSLRRTEEVVINAIVAAAKEVVHALDIILRRHLIEGWISTIGNRKARQKPFSTIATLGAAYEELASDDDMSATIIQSLLNLLGSEIEIETRVWTVNSLKTCAVADLMKKQKRAISTVDVVVGYTPVLDEILPAICHCMDD